MEGIGGGVKSLLFAYRFARYSVRCIVRPVISACGQRDVEIQTLACHIV